MFGALNLGNIKVGQLFVLSKNGSWDLVDACNFFGGVSLIRACTDGENPILSFFGEKEEVKLGKIQKKKLRASTRAHDPFLDKTKS